MKTIVEHSKKIFLSIILITNIGFLKPQNDLVWELKLTHEKTVFVEDKKHSESIETTAQIESKTKDLSNGNQKHWFNIKNTNITTALSDNTENYNVPGSFTFYVVTSPDGEVVSYSEEIPKELIDPGAFFEDKTQSIISGRPWTETNTIDLPGGLEPLEYLITYVPKKTVKFIDIECYDIEVYIQDISETKYILDDYYDIQISGGGTLYYAKETGMIIKNMIEQDIIVNYNDSFIIEQKNTFDLALQKRM
mgnify:CR=1 FL=1